MEINLRRTDDAFRMEASNEDGHIVVTDASEKVGGKNSAFRPMQMLLASLGACSSIDVIHILNRQRQPLDDIKIKITAERYEDRVPALFKHIHVHYDLYGNVKPEKAEQAVRLSMEKYCSVALTLEKAVAISYDHQLHATVTDK